ncbi:MAG: hypothetical protein Q9169_001226 [Polycauliona sp. 2 TL-2023]
MLLLALPCAMFICVFMATPSHAERKRNAEMKRRKELIYVEPPTPSSSKATLTIPRCRSMQAAPGKVCGIDIRTSHQPVLAELTRTGKDEG